ncbi:type II toxin-antitoxin system RelE/ParE family toxin [Verminephrobacter eiseniae]|uniref:type II toxin-antitoxin system RelE/ParE family toxin n=1 Tax=Verminephrobacter eiseniae TaxID=364317 RepID=UPI0022380E81|nr:type II toxin-antitoxin system RelE/ParE family toxin [Verminephrobacter eiseniae]
MTQMASLLTRTGTIQVEMPAPDEALMGSGSVHWGAFDVFPTPAYWQYQVMARRLAGRQAGYKLGRTLAVAIQQVMRGQADNLGGGVFKKRLNDNMHRSIILAKGARNWVYEYLFAKKDRDNIEDDELADFRVLQKPMLACQRCRLRNC